MRISIYGAGYVGLTTAVCFAQLGHEVFCLDVDSEKIAALKRGISVIHEAQLESFLKQCLASGKLIFTTDPEQTVAHGQFHFLAVPTPSTDSGEADVSYVHQAITNILSHYRSLEPLIIVNKSTVPVGTAQKLEDHLKNFFQSRTDTPEFHVVSNPEFLREGSAIQDFMQPARIIIGAKHENIAKHVAALYDPLHLTPKQVILMDPVSAELTKYAANSFLATKISFINEVSQIAENTGADIEWIRQGITSDPRIGKYFLSPGCGYGGSCFPKDVRALIHTARSYHVAPHILEAVDRVNETQKRLIFKKISKFFQGNLSGKTFALWGLAFKPGTDDMREAPSCTLINELLQAGANIRAYDPAASIRAAEIYADAPALSFTADPLDATSRANALILMTEWDEFLSIPLEDVKRNLQDPIVFDGRNLFNPSDMEKMGFSYYGVGRGTSIL